jgi:ABC-type transport system involved in multi-copper enzyme maturation permease subunit
MNEPIIAKSTPNSLMSTLARFLKPIIENPVILKELRGRMRGRRAFVSLTLYILLISLLIGSIYATAAMASPITRFDPSYRQGMGKAIFSVVVMLEFLMISFIGPSLTAGAITSERERRTYDLLRTTPLTAHALVLGKLGSACLYLLLLVITGLPVQALAFLLGGVGFEEIAVSSLMLITNILFFCTLGLFCSSFTKRTLTANVTSYTLILLGGLGLGLAYFALAMYASPLIGPRNQMTENFVAMVAWTLTATNPFSASIVSEVLLTTNQTLFFGKAPTGNIYIISPWILHIIFYWVLTVIMLFVSTLFVKRPDR